MATLNTTEFGYSPKGADYVEVEIVDLDTCQTISRRTVPKSEYFCRPPVSEVISQELVETT